VSIPTESGGSKSRKKSLKILHKAANLYKWKKEYQKAFEIYEKLHKVDPGDINVIYSLGYICKKMGRVEEAKIYFRNVLRIELTHKETLFQLGLISFEENTFDTAAIAFKKVLSIDICHMDAYLKLGDLYEKSGNREEAIKTYLAGSESLILKREHDKAIFLLKKIIELKPDHVEAREKLVDLDVDPDSPVTESFSYSVEEEKDSIESDAVAREGVDDLEEMSEEVSSFIDLADKSLETPEEAVEEKIFELDEREEISFQEEEVVESEYGNVSGPFEKKSVNRIMSLTVNTDCNFEDFLEEISIDFTLDPSWEKILEQNVDLVFTDNYSDEAISPVVFVTFMEEGVDNFSPDFELDDPDRLDRLYPPSYSGFLRLPSEETIDLLKEKIKKWATKFAYEPSRATRSLINSVNAEERSEDFEPSDKLGEPITVEELKPVIEKEEAFEPERVIPSDLIYEPSAEEFMELFVPGESLEEEFIVTETAISISEIDDETEVEEAEEVIEETEEAEEIIEETEEVIEEKEEAEEIIEEKEEVIEEIIEEKEEAEEIIEEKEEAEEVIEEKEEAKEIIEEKEEAEEIIEEKEEAEEVIEEKEEAEKIIEEKETAESVGIEENITASIKVSAISDKLNIPEVDNEIERCRERIKENSGEIDNVINIYKDFQKRYPVYIPLCCAMGSVYIKKGMFLEGLKEYMKTIDTGVLEGKDHLLEKI